MRRLMYLPLLLAAVAVLSACGSDPARPGDNDDTSPTATPTASVVTPTVTPSPTPVPTITPRPTNTPQPEPTREPTPKPVVTEEPTASPTERPVNPELPALQDALDTQREKWQEHGPESYVFEMEWQCFCPEAYVNPVEIRVSRGDIVSVNYVDTGEPVAQENWDRYRTVEGLFDLLQDAIDRKAHSIEIAYDPDMGHPSSVSVDYDERIIDEEQGFAIASLELAPDGPLPTPAPSPTPAGPPLSELQRELEDNRALWEAQGSADYTFEFQWNCFCLPEYRGPVDIQVSDGGIQSVTYTESGEDVPQEHWDRYSTVSALFDFIEDAISEDAHEIDVDYHPDLGYPTMAYVDYDPMIADEERGFEIERLEAGG